MSAYRWEIPRRAFADEIHFSEIAVATTTVSAPPLSSCVFRRACVANFGMWDANPQSLTVSRQRGMHSGFQHKKGPEKSEPLRRKNRCLKRDEKHPRSHRPKYGKSPFFWEILAPFISKPSMRLKRRAKMLVDSEKSATAALDMGWPFCESARRNAPDSHQITYARCQEQQQISHGTICSVATHYWRVAWQYATASEVTNCAFRSKKKPARSSPAFFKSMVDAYPNYSAACTLAGGVSAPDA